MVDARPQGVPVEFRPGTTVTVTLSWPSGALDGRTFSSTLDGEDLDVTVVDDTMTIVAADTITAGLTGTVDWLLLEDIGGTDEPIIIGTWTASTHAADEAQAAVTVTQASVAVAVTAGQGVGSAAAVQSALTTHQGVTGRAGAHGRVLLDFGHAGFGGLTKVIATADGDQVFTESVVDGRGRVTGTEPPDGNHRVWYLHPDTNWSEGRVTGVWWGPSQWDFSPGNRPQIGFVLGAQEYTPGSWVALVVWYNITGTPTSNAALVVNGWDVDGTTLQQGSGGNGGSIANVNRAARVIHARHQEFLGSELSVMTVAPPWSAVVPNGTPIVVSGMADSDYDIAAGTASNPSAGDTTVTSTLAAAPANPTDPIAGGTLTPEAPWNAAPYMISAERVGNSLRVSQWAYGAPPPDEGDPRTFTVALSQGAMNAFPSGPGLHGFMIGHCHSASYAEVGNILFEQIS